MVSQARIWSLTVWLFLHSDIKLIVKALTPKQPRSLRQSNTRLYADLLKKVVGKGFLFLLSLLIFNSISILFMAYIAPKI